MAARPSTALRAFRALTQSACASCRRPLSHTARALAGAGDTDTPLQSMEAMMANAGNNYVRAGADYFSNMIPGQGSQMTNLVLRDWDEDDRHKLNIYATKHNTHITLAKPDRNSLISVSCGNIGFRKAGRGTYDAGYQLAAFVMSRIKDKGLLPQIQKLELIYRGFGPGREAVTKAILSAEGKQIRPLIVKLSDSTRLKFGGVRSKKPRRLG